MHIMLAFLLFVACLVVAVMFWRLLAGFAVVVLVVFGLIYAISNSQRTIAEHQGNIIVNQSLSR